MAALFTAEWMQQLSAAWNADPGMLKDLGGDGFDARIAFGFKNESRATGYLEVRAGLVVDATAYRAQALDWDLRASAADWQLWLTEGFGLKRIGFTFATGRLKFVSGNYRQIIGQPSMARPFLRVFELMEELETDWPD